MSNEQDNTAFDAVNQATGQQNVLEVGQDEGTNNEENSTQDWEAQAKYHQSEKDKLFAENQQLKQYEKVGKFLESRPDVAQKVLKEDPKLALEKNKVLRFTYGQLAKHQNIWNYIS